MDQYSDAKHGKQYPNGPVEPHASPLLLDKGHRAEVMEFHKRRRNASLTRNAIDQSQDTLGSSAQKVERGRSMSRTNRDCAQEKNGIKRNTNPLPPVRGRCATTTINNPVGTAMGPVNIPQIRSRSVSGAVRDRMQSKRASAASNSPVPSARGRHEKETATSHRKDGSLTQRERGTSLPPDLQRTDSDSTDGNSVELVSQSYSFASASSDEQSVLQLKRQKARAMLARRKKSIRS